MKYSWSFALLKSERARERERENDMDRYTDDISHVLAQQMGCA